MAWEKRRRGYSPLKAEIILEEKTFFRKVILLLRVEISVVKIELPTINQFIELKSSFVLKLWYNIGIQIC